MHYYYAILLVLITLPVTLADNSTAPPCQDINNVADKCTFARDTDSCAIDEGFIDYIRITYCSFPGVIPLGIVLFIFWWLFLFLGLAVTADDFFCPSLTVMAKVLRMSDNIAGVTLLAFGNGAPDIFSAIAAVGNMKNGSDAGLAFGALLGAGVFVTAVVSGSVIITKPFQCMQRPLLRDITFYLAAVYYTFYIMQRRQITTLHAVGFLLLYVAYVLVVIVGRYIRKKYQTPAAQSDSAEADLSPKPSAIAALDADPDMPTTMSKLLADEAEHVEGTKLHHHHHHHDAHVNHSIQDGENNNIRPPVDKKAVTVTSQARVGCHPSVGYGYGYRRQARVESAQELIASHQNSDESTPLLEDSAAKEGSYSVTRELLDAINPICKEEFLDKKWYGRVYLIVKAPIQFLLTITCPVVDYESERNNWNRQLSALQILLGPMFGVFATNQYNVMLGSHFPLWAFFLCFFSLLSGTAFYASNNTVPPKWHCILAFLGFVVACIWIYCIANEIVNILQLFGVFFHISDAVLGLTLLAWGNSIGDLIADTALARRGFPRIGISACFGGPLFNLLLGVGIPFTIACIKNGGAVQLQFSFQLVVLTGGLTLSLLSTFIIAPFVLKFFMKRWFGIYLIGVYIAFLVTAILTETNLIKVDVSSW